MKKHDSFVVDDRVGFLGPTLRPFACLAGGLFGGAPEEATAGKSTHKKMF